MGADSPGAPRITILGSYSGRNAGDAAILASIMFAVSRELGERVQFEVPTTNPGFIREHYGKRFKVRPISVMPWTGSIRLLGIPTLRSIRRTDLTLITDGIIFDVKLFNPLFNFLIALVFLVPWARFCGKKVACYSVGIGPLTTRWGRRFARSIGDRCDLIMVREEDSLALFREVGVTKTIHLTADAVFLDWAAASERIDEILRSQGLAEEAEQNRLLGVNVTSYIDQWLPAKQKMANRAGLLPMVAEAIARLRIDHNVTSVIFTTQVMDIKFGRTLQELVVAHHRREAGTAWSPVLIDNITYDNHEILGLASRCRLFVGMRLHSLILAAEAGSPVAGLAYAPKVRSFLKQLGTPDQAYDLAELNSGSLYRGLADAWEGSGELRAVQQDVVGELEERAKMAARMIRTHFFPGTAGRNE